MAGVRPAEGALFEEHAGQTVRSEQQLNQGQALSEQHNEAHSDSEEQRGTLY